MSAASLNITKPSSPRPWKLYGDVLGLNAPPLSPFPPLATTPSAVSSVCSLYSALSGPAIKANSLPPITRSFILTSVFPSLKLLLASL